MRHCRPIPTLRCAAFLAAVAAVVVLSPRALAQFSPGDLSKAHHDLEGSQNCVRCHDVGQEISGVKCLSCHGEIKALADARKGFHGAVAAQRCVECHKEHLGVNAAITKFDARTFEHGRSGFLLDGRHAVVACEKCHQTRFVRDPAVLSSLRDHPRATYLGLDTKCARCHEDVHKGKFRQACADCHSTAGWKGGKKFDHASAQFPLEGKHATVDCAKCHTAMNRAGGKGPVDFASKPFEDCTPCHTSPHKPALAALRCASCHTAQGWAGAMERPFDHSRTAYTLRGRHTQITCASCHRLEARQSFAQTFLRPFARCTDCHADKHDGAFAKKYRNDCAACHTVDRFAPSTFPLARHAESRFPLTGAHQAVLCASCHARGAEGAPSFQLASLRCDACHRDVHKGQFAAAMKEKSCAACHTTERWSDAQFDHATTSFPLLGRHAAVGCERCHKERAVSGAAVQYKKIPSACESCHKDQHRAQFAKDGATACVNCHQPEGWKRLRFDHETQSSFRLTGAHRNVACASCHRAEEADGTTFIRYKPLESACASCHAKGGRG